MSARGKGYTVDGDDLLLELLESSIWARRDSALLLWHRIYGWPALRELDREWPMPRLVSP